MADRWVDCVRCRAAVPWGARVCLKCGRAYPRGAGRRARRLRDVFILLALVACAAVLLHRIPPWVFLVAFLLTALGYAWRQRVEGD